MTLSPDGVTIPHAAGKPAVFRRDDLAGKADAAGCLTRQPVPDSDWHVTLFQVFYQASWKPGHATDTSTRPVESNSPPNQCDAKSTIGMFSIRHQPAFRQVIPADYSGRIRQTRQLPCHTVGRPPWNRNQTANQSPKPLDPAADSG